MVPRRGTLLSTDSFNRADASTLGSTDGAGSLDPLAWAISHAAPAEWHVTTNRAELYQIAGGTSDHAATVDLGTADVDVSVAWVGIGGGGQPGICFRYVDAGNFWAARCPDGSSPSTARDFRVMKRVAGANTDMTALYRTRASYASPLGSVDPGLTIRVVAVGNRILALLNDIIIFDVSDSTHNTATRHGLYSVGPGSDFFDRWQANAGVL